MCTQFVVVGWPQTVHMCTQFVVVGWPHTVHMYSKFMVEEWPQTVHVSPVLHTVASCALLAHLVYERSIVKNLYTTAFCDSKMRP